MACNCFGDADESSTDAPVVLTVGLQNAGKSLLLQRLSDLLRPPGGLKASNPAAVAPADAVSIMPTIGTELIKLHASKGKLSRPVVAREVGGQMQPLWHHYYTEASAVMFVVDAAAAAKAAQAAITLFGLLQHEQLQGKPFCVVLHKSDVPSALSFSQLDTVLRLHDLQIQFQGQLHIQAASAVTGDGLLSLSQWIDEAAGTAAGQLTQQQRQSRSSSRVK